MRGMHLSIGIAVALLLAASALCWFRLERAGRGLTRHLRRPLLHRQALDRQGARGGWATRPSDIPATARAGLPEFMRDAWVSRPGATATSRQWTPRRPCAEMFHVGMGRLPAIRHGGVDPGCRHGLAPSAAEIQSAYARVLAGTRRADAPGKSPRCLARDVRAARAPARCTVRGRPASRTPWRCPRRQRRPAAVRIVGDQRAADANGRDLVVLAQMPKRMRGQAEKAQAGMASQIGRLGRPAARLQARRTACAARARACAPPACCRSMCRCGSPRRRTPPPDRHSGPRRPLPRSRRDGRPGRRAGWARPIRPKVAGRAMRSVPHAGGRGRGVLLDLLQGGQGAAHALMKGLARFRQASRRVVRSIRRRPRRFQAP